MGCMLSMCELQSIEVLEFWWGYYTNLSIKASLPNLALRPYLAPPGLLASRTTITTQPMQPRLQTYYHFFVSAELPQSKTRNLHTPLRIASPKALRSYTPSIAQTTEFSYQSSTRLRLLKTWRSWRVAIACPSCEDVAQSAATLVSNSEICPEPCSNAPIPR